MPDLSSKADEAVQTMGVLEEALKGFSWQKLVVLVCLFLVSLVAIRVIVRLVDRAMERGKMERGARTFLRSGLRVMLWLVAVSILLGYLGVPMTSLVAVLSVLGVAVSLAVQGILGNLAGGIMLLSAHPFAAGDFVSVGEVSGTVVEVSLVYTKLSTPDNKIVYIPNGEISTKTLTNFSAQATRRVELTIPVSYDAPVEAVKAAIQGVIAGLDKTLNDPAPIVRLANFGSSSLEYHVRAWCGKDDYWETYYALVEGIKAAFDKAGIEITYDHLNVHLLEKK